MKKRAIFLLLLSLAACSPKEEEEIDYDSMVMLEQEEEWTSSRPEKLIAGDVSPDPQEVVIMENLEDYLAPQ